MSSDPRSFDLSGLNAYPSARDAVEQLVTQIVALLSTQLVGLYFDGSVALGDFDPERSDIDIVVVTQDPLSNSAVGELEALHEDFARSVPAWGDEVEIIYVSKNELDHQAVRRKALHRYVERGTNGELKTGPLGLGWLVHLSVLSRNGITIAGPGIRELVTPIEVESLRHAAAEHAERRLQLYLGKPTLLQGPGARAFAVLTACRMVYTFRTGDIIPKMHAASAMIQLVDPQLAGVIRAAMNWRKDDREFHPTPREVVRVLKFVRDQVTL